MLTWNLDYLKGLRASAERGLNILPATVPPSIISGGLPSFSLARYDWHRITYVTCAVLNENQRGVTVGDSANDLGYSWKVTAWLCNFGNVLQPKGI